MHPDYQRADNWSPKVIGAAIEVHRDKGPGLLESIYQRCLLHELALRGIPAEREVRVPITYKDLVFDEEIRLDVLVDRCLVIEIKAVEAVLPIHLAQTLSYMRLLNVPVGIIVNFHEPVLKQGIRRLTLRGADQP